jgi:hypothetical protein
MSQENSVVVSENNHIWIGPNQKEWDTFSNNCVVWDIPVSGANLNFVGFLLTVWW